jgi:hypothetical protein
VKLSICTTTGWSMTLRSPLGNVTICSLAYMLWTYWKYR